MSSNEYFLDTIQKHASEIIASGGLESASRYIYMLEEQYSHIDFDTVFSHVSNLVEEVEDNAEFVLKASEYAMDYYIDFQTLMTIATVELAFRVVTVGLENGLEQIH